MKTANLPNQMGQWRRVLEGAAAAAAGRQVSKHLQTCYRRFQGNPLPSVGSEHVGVSQGHSSFKRSCKPRRHVKIIYRARNVGIKL